MSWAAVKSYAEQVIPVIRAADPDAVVIVGTRGWSSLGVSDGSSESEVVNNPVNATNIMYALPLLRREPQGRLPRGGEPGSRAAALFVSEFGTVSATGGGAVDEGEQRRVAGPARPVEDRLRELDVLRRRRGQRGVQAGHLRGAPTTAAAAY